MMFYRWLLMATKAITLCTAIAAFAISLGAALGLIVLLVIDQRHAWIALCIAIIGWLLSYVLARCHDATTEILEGRKRHA